MDQYTVFMCLRDITPVMKQICEQKEICIIETYDKPDVHNYNNIAKELLKHKNIFISNVQMFITKKLDFHLNYEIQSRLYIQKPYYFLILDKPIDEYYNDEKLQIKRIQASTLSLSKFSDEPLDKLIPKNIIIPNTADMERVKAIAPCFYDYCIQDLLPLLYDILQEIRLKDYKSKHIKSWPISFDKSFDSIDDNNKYKLLRKVEEKYHDFDDIIFRTSSQMKSSFSESYKSKLYAGGTPDLLHLKHPEIKDGKFRFRIIVQQEGKKSDYFESAGGFFVPWN